MGCVMNGGYKLLLSWSEWTRGLIVVPLCNSCGVRVFGVVEAIQGVLGAMVTALRDHAGPSRITRKPRNRERRPCSRKAVSKAPGERPSCSRKAVSMAPAYEHNGYASSPRYQACRPGLRESGPSGL
jgi:hypothetical protein